MSGGDRAGVGSRTKTQLETRVSTDRHGSARGTHALGQFDGETHDAPGIGHGLALV